MALQQRGKIGATSTSGIDPEVKALSRKALAILKAKSANQDRSEKRVIESAIAGNFGEPIHALRNLIANLPNHEAVPILYVYTDAIKAGLPSDFIVTDDHIMVRDALQQHYIALLQAGKIAFHDQVIEASFESIWSYAMHHVEDGHLILNMYVERGIRTLEEMLDLLPDLKGTGHQAVTRGVL